jgi:hypothetical protein
MMTVEWSSAASHWMMSRLKWCLDSPWVWHALAANPLGSHSNSSSNWKLVVVVVVVHKALVVARGLLSRQSRQLTRMCT